MVQQSPVRSSLLRDLPLLGTVLLLGAGLANAAELVTLRSGFSVVCASREAIAPGRVRLHLSAAASAAENYMDVPLAAIAAVESLPDQLKSNVSTPSIALPKAGDLAGILQGSGATHNVNVALLASVIKAESGGNAHAVSHAGARGLMQLMPQTAAALRVRDSFSPQDNVDGGSAYLDGLLTRYHENIALALAAYNAGPAAVDRYRGVPPYRETRLYVARVLNEFNRLVKQDAGAAMATAIPQTTGR